MPTRFAYRFVLPLLLAAVLTGAGACSLLSRGASASDAAAPTRIVKLDNTIVNLADTDSSAYVRLAVALSLASPEPKDPAAEQAMQSIARDTILNVTGAQTSEQLLAADGKQELKQAILKGLQKRLPEAHITAVYFVDFLVQH